MKIGIADTTFARFDMGSLAETVIKEKSDHEPVRYTVPGFKDLAVAAKKLIEEENCGIVLAFAYSGKEEIDKQCAAEANIGLMQAELLTNTHILKVFVFEDERESDLELKDLITDRVTKHTVNAIKLLEGKTALKVNAGSGKRQGSNHVGAL